MFDTAVIGAGISGLVVAHELKKLGHRVVVLERQAHAGGNAISERIGGFLMEHGPCTISAFRPAPRVLATELDLEDAMCGLGPGAKHRYMMKDGRLVAMAASPLGILRSNYLSLPSRVRLLMDIFVPPGQNHDQETVGAFSRRRFGREFTEKIMDPLVAGLYAGDLETSPVATLFPGLVALEQRTGSVIRGALAAHIRKKKEPGKRLYSWRDGIATLPRTLARHLGSSLRTGVDVRRIVRSSRGFCITTGRAGQLEVHSVVIAAQPHVSAALLEEVADHAATAAASVNAPPLAVVFMGFRRSQVAHPLDGVGYLTPSNERRSITGVHFNSTMFPGRAPDGHVALTAYVGGSRAPVLGNMPADTLKELVRDEFHDLLGVTGDPVVVRVRHWPRGLPQFSLGHKAVLEALRNLPREAPGLFVTGNYLEGPSVGACVKTAQDVAGAVNTYLANSNSFTGESAVRAYLCNIGPTSAIEV